jgi:hypothetical protein
MEEIVAALPSTREEAARAEAEFANATSRKTTAPHDREIKSQTIVIRDSRRTRTRRITSGTTHLSNENELPSGSQVASQNWKSELAQ